MIKESNWEECIENDSSMPISPDKEKAKSLRDTAQDRIKYLNESKIKESNVNFMFEGYYSSILELLHALIILRGYKVTNHICLGYYLRDVLQIEEIFRIFDDCRFKRNSLVYYGRKMDFATGKDTLELCVKIINAIDKLLK